MMHNVKVIEQAIDAMHDHGTSFLNHEDAYASAIEALRSLLDKPAVPLEEVNDAADDLRNQGMKYYADMLEQLAGIKS